MNEFETIDIGLRPLFPNPERAYAMISNTDSFKVIWLSDLKKEELHTDKLLELRVFDAEREWRIYRDYIGNEFHPAIDLSEAVMSKYDHYDDEQFMDGRSENLKVRIRNYIDYDDQGQAFLKAWRLVGFCDADGNEVNGIV